MQPFEREVRGASLDVLRAVLCAIVLLLGPLLSVALPEEPPATAAHAVSTTTRAVTAIPLAAAAQAEPSQGPDLVAAPETLSESLLVEGESEQRERDCKQPSRLPLGADRDASATTAVAVEEIVVSPIRLVAFPSRAPPLS